MLWWIVDNLNVVLLALGIVALCFAAAWWTSRKNKLLLGVGIPIALMAVAWLLSLFIVTDQMQLVRNVETMRDLFNAGKLTEAIAYFEDEVKVDSAQGTQTVKKAMLLELAKANKQHFGLKKVVTNAIAVEEVARPQAVVTFYVGPEDSGERGRCIVGWTLSPDGKWRVRTFTVESVVGGHKLPLVVFPF